MSKGSSAATQDIRSFFHCLRVDPQTLATDHKFHRRGELKRTLGVALGISPDDSQFVSTKGRLLPSLSPEDVRKTKAGLRAGTTEARERCKVFSEALSLFNKFFPAIPSRKRSRPDGVSGDRDTAVLSGDRYVLGSSVSKMGFLSNPVADTLEAEQQKSEEGVNNTIMNKRTRTSLLDTKANFLSRHSTHLDHNKEVVRSAKSGAPISKDCRPMGVGWDKSKMKKKRSGIKPDVSPGKVSVETIDGNNELKQGMRQRLVSDLRSRVNESESFRVRPGSGAIGFSKPDGTLRQSGTNVRSSVARGDQEGNALLTEKKDPPITLDKHRVNLKSVNNSQEDHSSSGPTSSMKTASSARGPRSNSGTLTKSSPTSHRPISASDWEIAQCTNRPSTSSGVGNRKRALTARSSSPPVAHWAGQRPQKISRTARRTNFPSIVPTDEEFPALDSSSDIGNGSASALARRFSGSSLQQAKLKADRNPSAVLSDSEESAVAEVKPKEKKKALEKKDDKGVQSVNKTSTLLPPPLRKNVLIGREELGDGVRKQGRINRTLMSSSRSVMSKVDKFGKVRTAKQLRTSKMALDKAESKVGRPPTRKLSDRKAYSRNKYSTFQTADFLGSNDGKEELLAAAKAVINESKGHANSFWRQMEPAFQFISEADVVFLKQQEEAMPISCTPSIPGSVDGYKSFNIPSELAGAESHRHTGLCSFAAKDTVSFTEQLISEAVPSDADPLFQRLMAALITDANHDCSNGRSDEFQVDSSSIGPVDSEFDSGDLGHKLLGTSHAANSDCSTGCRNNAAGELMDEVDENEEPNLESAMMAVQNIGGISCCGSLYNRTLPNSNIIPLIESTEFQYANKSLHDRLLVEIQSFGIRLHMPEMIQTNNDEISQEFRHWEDKSSALGAKKRGRISKVLTSASDIKELQEREFEHLAMEKLTTMAYEKYMACFVGKAKTMRQAALDFVLRVLDRCQKYEATGTSCFSESSFKDMFTAALCRLSDIQSSDSISDNETSRAAWRSSLAWSLVGQPSQNNDTHSSNAHMPETCAFEPDVAKEDAWSNKVKKREISLGDAGGNAIVMLNGLPALESSAISNVKGKRSDREREGKGHLGSRNGTANYGRPVGGSTKGDRKPKAKAKQKTTQLSASANSLMGQISEQTKTPFSPLPACRESTTNDARQKDEFGLSEDDPVVDLSSLQIPELDVDLGGQGEDLASWLNIDDDGLQDHDFMGLEIPMDDLADVNMMF